MRTTSSQKPALLFPNKVFPWSFPWGWQGSSSSTGTRYIAPSAKFNWAPSEVFGQTSAGSQTCFELAALSNSALRC